MWKFVETHVQRAACRPFHERFVQRLSVALALCLVSLVVSAGTVQGLRINESPDHTRVVFDLSSPTPFVVDTLTGPHRVIVDLPDAALGAGFSEAVASNRKRIRNLRVARRDGGYRLVFDTPGPMAPNAFALRPVAKLGPNAPYGHRLVVDLFDTAKSKTAPLTTQPKPPVVASRPKLQTKPAPRKEAQTELKPPNRPVPVAPTRRRNVLVAIDPGHGGNDPGAPGPGKIREKDVVLAISNKLAAQINKQPGFEAVLIRSGDYYVNLRERVRQARAKGADLFVSIHADAFTSPKVHGASVYTLSESGASSETARLLAAKENTSDLIGGVGRVSLGDKDDLLAEVLIDMSTHANRSLSRQAGAAVLRELGNVTDLHKSVVEKAGFIVLKAPDVPSILVETGYISNPAEARRLATASYQNKLANAIAKGVVRYLKEEPPPGTLLADNAARASRSYTIQRGDTLSGLAARYGIEARSIRVANDLRSDAIRVGQKLIIPAS